jgi:hypothetical protein
VEVAVVAKEEDLSEVYVEEAEEDVVVDDRA